MMKGLIEVDGVWFNIKNVKDLGKKEFLKTYKGKLKGVDVESAYYKITGIKQTKKKSTSSKNK